MLGARAAAAAHPSNWEDPELYCKYYFRAERVIANGLPTIYYIQGVIWGSGGQVTTALCASLVF